MSDALCGPSNALQSFQKHASVDRTLQQDRIVSRSSPSQGFRSPNPREGVLDPEFAAFESNIPGAPLSDLHHATPFAQGPHFMPPAESQSWAADFQNLQISGPSHPIHQQPGLSVSPAPMMAQQGWQNEFMNQQQHQQRHTPIQQHQPYTHGFQSSFAPSYPMHASPMNAFPAAQEGIANQHPETEAFDESAFEAAFEQARADMASQAAEITQENTEESTAEATHLETTTSPEPQETIRIGSDTIPQSNKEDPQSRVNDADELARTAGQLLDSVSHDQSQKFRESNFLALMRRIRDREVHVEGDEFRETSQSLHPGGKYYPGGQRARQEEHTNHDTTTTTNYEGNSTILNEKNSTPSTGSIGGAGAGDDDSLYAGWNYGDRWA